MRQSPLGRIVCLHFCDWLSSWRRKPKVSDFFARIVITVSTPCYGIVWHYIFERGWRWDGIIRQRFCHHHLLLEQVVIVESSNHFFFFFFSSSQSSMIVSLRMSGFLLLLENDYLGGGQGQVAKSCHFFDSNEVKCIHHPISQKSGDFVIYFYRIRSFQ